MKNSFVVGAVVIVLAAGVGLAVWAPVRAGDDAGAGDVLPLAYKDADVVADGAALYAENCAACHGANLEGQGDWRVRDARGYLPAPPHDETGHTWHHPEAMLFEITKLGTEAMVGGDYRSDMIGFGDVLSDDQIAAVLAYIKSTWPQQIIEMHDEMSAARQ